MTRTTFSRVGLAAVIVIPFVAQVSGQSPVERPIYPPPPHEKQAPEVEKNLKVFDVLDFDVFSNQQWSRLGESHAKDIVVTWPDGHETKGIDKHIEDLKAIRLRARHHHQGPPDPLRLWLVDDGDRRHDRDLQ